MVLFMEKKTESLVFSLDYDNPLSEATDVFVMSSETLDEDEFQKILNSFSEDDDFMGEADEAISRLSVMRKNSTIDIMTSKISKLITVDGLDGKGIIIDTVDLETAEDNGNISIVVGYDNEDNEMCFNAYLLPSTVSVDDVLANISQYVDLDSLLVKMDNDYSEIEAILFSVPNFMYGVY